jgi:uncharacterized membrane protein (UPF0127 family)
MTNDRHQLIDADTGTVIVARLKIADTFWRRFRGLQFRRELASDEGLLLTPCRSIHTHWMRFSIDVAMLDHRGLVLQVLTNIRPWRLVKGTTDTNMILEVISGRLEHQLVGCRLQVVEQPSGSFFFDG